MNPVDADNHPAQQLAQALATRLERWSLQIGAKTHPAQAVAQWAKRLSLATSEGHVCVVVEEPDQRATLMASSIVNRHTEPLRLPLVLDGEGRLYFHRSFDDERQLATRLIQALRHAHMPPVTDTAVALLRERFAPPAAPSGEVPTVDRQMLAVALALLQPVVVLSGGPGTGKTTTLAAMLACMKAQDPSLRAGLAATTGKAAARMTAALAGQDSLQARTVHAWLGINRQTGQARFNAKNPLPLDVLVIDEASMLDLALTRQLVDALPLQARLVLLGDKDQLAAVQAGAVFAELAANATMDGATTTRLSKLCNVPESQLLLALHGTDAVPPTPPTALANGVIWLTHSHRFDARSGIGQLAALVRDGGADAALALLKAAAHADVSWVDLAPEAPEDNEAQAPSMATALTGFMRKNLTPFAKALAAAFATPSDTSALSALKALDHFRLLSAVREGPYGTHALNRWAALQLQQQLDAFGATTGRSSLRSIDARHDWFAGRPVMVTRNDAALGLSNGDVGITMPADVTGPWRVVFLRANGSCVSWPITRLPAVETAFCATVHKSQGSEFQHVALVLPNPWQRTCTRELVYTAVTRARTHVTLVTSADTWRQAIATRTQRVGGLRTRLFEAAA